MRTSWLVVVAACSGGSGDGRVVRPAPVPVAATTVVVEEAGRRVAMTSAVALLDAHGDVTLWLSDQALTCAQALAAWEDRPGEVSFSYTVGQQLQPDGSIRWAMRGFSHGGSSTSSAGDDLPNAIVENRPGGRIKIAVAADDGSPLELRDGVTATGMVETTVCPDRPPAAPSQPATGFADIAGKRYPITTALLAKNEGPGRAITTFSISVVSAEFSCAESYMVGSELKLSWQFEPGSDQATSVSIEGSRMTSPAFAQDDSFAFVNPALLATTGDREIQLGGEARYLRDQRLYPGEAPYPVKLGGTVRLLDCRK